MERKEKKKSADEKKKMEGEEYKSIRVRCELDKRRMCCLFDVKKGKKMEIYLEDCQAFKISMEIFKSMVRRGSKSTEPMRAMIWLTPLVRRDFMSCLSAFSGK